ncbi:MAG: hypothetical protein HY454_03300 [Parcubacteria group bacterium]|nr:hypothetical protein [Parcubacteria group bacterium]
MNKQRRRRVVSMWVFCISGEIEIGYEKTAIEREVPEEKRHIAACTEAQATKLFADRFTRIFKQRVYIGNALVEPVKYLPPDPPSRPVISPQRRLF